MARTPQQTWKLIAKTPSFAEGWILNDAQVSPRRLLLRATERDLLKKTNRNFLNYYSEEPKNGFRPVGFPVDIGSDVTVSISPSEKYIAYFKPEKTEGDAKPKCFIEIWDCQKMLCCLSTEGKHGAIYTDEWFKGFSWSSNESKIVYIAEPLPPTPVSVFDDQQVGSEEPNLDQFIFREDWGETYTKRCKPRPYVVDWRAETITAVGEKSIPDELCCGQVRWAPNDTHIVFAAWNIGRRRLGIVHCFNRPSSLYALPVDAPSDAPCTTSPPDTPTPPPPVLLTPGDGAARSPRFSPDGRLLAYLAIDAVKTHNTCARLRVLPWPVGSGDVRTLIEVVDTALAPDFPGLYCAFLPARCWLPDSSGLVLHTPWRTSSVVLHVNASTGAMTPLTPIPRPVPSGQPLEPTPPLMCYAVLDVSANDVLVVASGPAAPPRVALLTIEGSGGATQLTTVVDNPAPLPDAPPLTASLLSLHPPDIAPSDSTSDFEALLFVQEALLAPSGPRPPLHVHVHGGPHGSFLGEFRAMLYAWAAAGYALLLVNYRGSTGFGKAPLESLAGRVGSQDVADCLQAVEEVLKRGLADASRVVVTGGSHGGFLTCHLIGQAPHVFKVAACLNPVCNILSMPFTSDIPDWCYCECGVDEELGPAAADVLKRMHAMSPVHHIRAVKTPLLIMLGDKDRRVPASQGLEFYHSLRTLGAADVRLLVYPENDHSIAKVDAEGDCFVNMTYWFKKHLPSPPSTPPQ